MSDQTGRVATQLCSHLFKRSPVYSYRCLTRISQLKVGHSVLRRSQFKLMGCLIASSQTDWSGGTFTGCIRGRSIYIEPTGPILPRSTIAKGSIPVSSLLYPGVLSLLHSPWNLDFNHTTCGVFYCFWLGQTPIPETFLDDWWITVLGAGLGCRECVYKDHQDQPRQINFSLSQTNQAIHFVLQYYSLVDQLDTLVNQTR